MRVTACIVNYNDLENTIRAVRSILAHTRRTDFQLYVVDNSDQDEDAERLRELFPEVRVIRAAKNKGFGAAHNMVINTADSDYHAIINPDITLESDVISGFCTLFDEYADIGIACPNTVFPDGRVQMLPRRNPTIKYLAASRLPFGLGNKTRAHYVMADEDLSEIRDVDFVTGCFMFARTALLKKAGGFDERYFLYLEDADLTREVKKYARAVYVPFLTVTHDWNRKSARSAKYFFIHVASVIKYMRKWKSKAPKNA